MYNFIKYFKQHHQGEHMKEAIMTSTIMTVVLTTPTTPRTTTSTTNTEKIEPTRDIDIITEEYSKKNIKGSHHFERYSENRTTEGEIITSPVTVSEKETEDSSTTKKIVYYTETMEEDIDLTMLPHDNITDNIIDNNTSSISPNESIVGNVTLKYNIKTVDIIEKIASSKSIESMTDKYSLDMYYNTEKSKVDTAIDNITTPTLSPTLSLNDFEEYAAENFTNKYESLKAAIVTDITTDPEKSTSVKYFSDLYNYAEKSQFDVTNDIITSTSPTQSTPEEDTKYSTTYLNYKEFTTNPEYSPTLINENITEKNSSATMNYTSAIDESFSSTIKIRNVM